jgi:small-conductance mechanosensitive channel
VLRVSGLTRLALTVIGGTGIAGLVLGIAFRDIMENFLASILISMQQPFRASDLIGVAGLCWLGATGDDAGYSTAWGSAPGKRSCLAR